MLSNRHSTKEMIPKYMTPPKFAEFTGIPLREVRRMMKAGKLDGFITDEGRAYILAESYKCLARPLSEI